MDGLREEAIVKANKTMHDQQDMVKALKAKMLMCDVAYEQQAQKAMRDRKAAIQRDVEKHWVEVEKEKMKEYDEKMRAKLEQEYKLKMQNAKDISDQLENFKLNYIKGLKEEMLEGELIKRQVEEDIEREKLREVGRQKRVAQMRNDLSQANKEMMQQKEADLLKDLEDEKRVAHHATKAQALETMKKEKEEQRFKDKLESR